MSLSLQVSPIKPSSASIGGLPAELLSGIAELLSGPQLNQLRLTCREIYNKTVFRFGTHNFETMTVEVSPVGMRRLMDICMHDKYTTYVRRVSLQAHNGVHGNVIKLGSGPNGVGFCAAWLECYHSGDLAPLLNTCFCRLKNLAHLWIAQPRVSHILIDYGVEDFRHEWTMMVETVLSVICEQQIHLETLEIGNQYNIECPPNMSILETIALVPELFDSVKKLSLALYIAKDKRSDYQVPWLTRGLKRMKRLESLTLSFDRSTRSGEVLAAVSQHVGTFPALRRLQLRRVLCSCDVLVKFIGMGRANVRDIDLTDVSLNSGGAKDLFIFLSTELSLGAVSLADLYEGTRYVSFKSIRWDRPIILDGWDEPLPSKEESEMVRSYHYIARDCWTDDCVPLDLAEEDGDDVRQWLSVIADKYELVDYRRHHLVY